MASELCVFNQTLVKIGLKNEVSVQIFDLF